MWRMPPRADLLPGTLDLLILKAVSLGSLHGYAVLQRIEQMTGGALLVEQGALYPALYRRRPARAEDRARQLESADDGDVGGARHQGQRGVR